MSSSESDFEEASPVISDEEEAIEEIKSSKRPHRNKTVPAKLSESAEEQKERFIDDETTPAVVMCSQTSKKYTAKVCNLSREDGTQLTKQYLQKGAELMWTHEGKDWPVTFVEWKDKVKKPGNKRSAKTLKEPSDATVVQKKNKVDVANLLAKAKDSVEAATVKPLGSQLNEDLLVNIAQRVERIEKMVEKLGHRLKEKSGGNSRHSSKEDDQGVIINGIDVLRIPAKDEYAYGLRLMEVLFTKEEMSESLLFESKKSDRKGLDQERVSQLFSLVDKRYGKNTLNIKKFKDKANQKCRDTRM